MIRIRVIGPGDEWIERDVSCACVVVDELELEAVENLRAIAFGQVESLIRVRYDAELAAIERLPCLAPVEGVSCLDWSRLHGAWPDVLCQRCDHWADVDAEAVRASEAIPERLIRLLSRTLTRYWNANAPAPCGPECVHKSRG